MAKTPAKPRAARSAPAAAEPAIIDCAVHPQVVRPDDLKAYMREPWNARAFPRPERYFYPAIGGEYIEGTAATGLAGSDPELLAKRLFDEGGVAIAHLVPQTRGLLPDLDLGTVVCRATNDWLADCWLGAANAHGRFRGTIRVNPGDPAGAVEEIERWSDHPGMVSITVPMQSHQPYGQRAFFPVWEAAARAGLPVLVKIDGGSGVDFWPTAVGHPHHYVEYKTVAPLAYAYHLISFIAEGVFTRLPDLRVVFADGGHDLLPPLVWRMDKNWRPTRRETPWVEELPSAYVRRQVRFCTSLLEGPSDPAVAEGWLELGEGADLLVYASRYPFHDYQSPAAASVGLPDASRERIMGGNAAALFRRDAKRRAA
ncbi:MAG: amidohydrolase family protein [Hyphomicrobiaceae bacterium]|nr:amidohydrolase family protein [Hyphomicrobiaceae bacterium]